jgi:nucleoid DNA-binding protein
MAKALTKSQIASEIAEKNGITKTQAVEILEHLAALPSSERASPVIALGFNV